MRRPLLALLFGAACGACLSSGPAAAQPPRAAAPNSAQIINFNVVDALAAIGAQELGGVFTFIPEDRTSMAMAAYLMESPKALKRFIKKASADRKEFQAINAWDKEVLLYLVGMGSSGQVSTGGRSIPESAMKKIQALSLEPALPRDIMMQRRALRK
jgi:hypothetical protein